MDTLSLRRTVVDDDYLRRLLLDTKDNRMNARALAENLNLSAEQCRMVMKELDIVNMEIYKSLLTRNETFPVDLLYAQAQKVPDWLLAEAIMRHPNTTNEIKILLYLQGNIRPIFYKND